MFKGWKCLIFMKKLKCMIYIFICFIICTGCNIKYNLNIENFEENINVNNVSFKNENEFVSPTDSIFQGRPYNIEFLSSNELIAEQRWNNVNDYIKYSIFVNDYAGSDNIVVNGSKIELNLSLTENAKILIDSIGKVDNIEFSLYVPYYVSKHNANKVNKNTYTWQINNIENANVIINFDMSKPADYKNKIIGYCVIGVIVIAIICVIIYFVSKNKKANEI